MVDSDGEDKMLCGCYELEFPVAFKLFTMARCIKCDRDVNVVVVIETSTRLTANP